MAYTPRIVDTELDALMPELAAVALEGARGVGKTATASRRAATTFDLGRDQRQAMVAADPGQIVGAPRPVFIDEWQRVPAVWEEVRQQVDGGVPGGSYVLAGSASPPPGVRLHSGAGRIVRLMMRPLAMCERALVQPTVSLSDLMQGRRPPVAGRSSVDLATYIDEIVRSGFPGIRGLGQRARRAQLDGYLARAVDHDLEDNGTRVRRPEVLRGWLTAYAAATGTTASLATILAAATPGDADKPSRATGEAYRAALERLFLLDPVPGWSPSLSSLTRVVQAPKHHLVDPALAARLLGIDAAGLMGGAHGAIVGALFESLSALTVRVVAQAAEARVLHLRTRGGEHEVDLIVEGPDRRVLAIEVKLGGTVGDGDVRHLRWLKEQIGERLVDAMVVTTGPGAYRRRDDGVAVVPLALLGP